MRHTVSEERSNKGLSSRVRLSKHFFRVAIVLYVLGIGYLSFLTVRSFLSPYGFIHAPEAWDMHKECVQSSAFPGCMYDIIEYDFTYIWAYHGLAYHYHDLVAPSAMSDGRIGTALIAEARFLWNLQLYYLLLWSTLPFFLGWTILFGYLLLYPRIAGYSYKWIEALITGFGTAFLIWSVEHFIPLPGPDATLSPSSITFIIIYIVLWFGPDIWFRQTDNFIAKAILLAGTLAAFAIFPLEQNLKLIVVPLFTLALAFGYGYWRTIEDRRRQLSVLIYTTLIVGVTAAVAKHWGFFTSGIFTGQYEQADLGELVNDFIVFFLAFLLSYLELGREEKPASTVQLERALPLPSTPVMQAPVNAQSSRQRTIIMSGLIGMLAGILGVLYVRNLFGTRSREE